MAELESKELGTDTPEVDVRSYSEGSTTFYEVGESKAWMEVSDNVLVPEEDWR